MADTASSGRHRPRHGGRSGRRIAGSVAGVTAALVLAAGVAVGVARHDDGGPPCAAGPRTLTVAAAPEIAPVVAEVASALAAADESGCRRTTVRADDPATVADALRPQAPPLRRTSPSARNGPAPPDVWIPDSSVWAALAGPGAAATERPSVARSPAVLAVPTAAARALGWPRRPLSVAALLDGAPAGQHPRLALPDPGTSAAAIGAVLALQATVAERPDGRQVLTAALRAAEAGLPARAAELLARSVAAGLLAVPVSEQAVWAHNASAAQRPTVVAAYGRAGGLVLDYPFLVLGEGADTAADAARLLAALHGETGRNLLADRGFRAADGAASAALTPHLGVDPAVAATGEPPPPDRVAAAVRTADTVRRGARMLAVLDVSGSMASEVPGAGGATRLDLTREAAARALELYPDDSEIGLWVFSTDLTPVSDYRELVPLGPLAERFDGIPGREYLALALAEVRNPDGGTGLYDTTLAAVRAVRAGWDPDRVNSVVLLSDGENDDDGLTLKELLATLRSEGGTRPVPVITIAFGAESDPDALRAISEATGGATYVARDPRDIRRVFLDAIGQRPCRPDC